MEQACEIITCSQFPAIWKHADKSSSSGVNYRLGDSSQGASSGFLNVALMTLGLPRGHLFIYSTPFLECPLRTLGSEHGRQGPARMELVF